jgi:hypothetical protein
MPFKKIIIHKTRVEPTLPSLNKKLDGVDRAGYQVLIGRD